MRRYLPGLIALAACAATQSLAGGIDRSPLNYNILFETGRTLEFGLQHVAPQISGTYIAALGGGSSGNMAQSFSTLSFGFKDDINDKLSYAVLVGQPIGADARYPSGAYTGLEAHWTSEEATALLKYKLGGGASVFGGLRYVNSTANIIIPLPPPAPPGTVYTAKADRNAKAGYLLGVAFEKPEIALRVALTYTSAITHKFSTTESVLAAQSITQITLPQTVTLDGQTGIAANTLLFGSVRWAQWSKWHVKPPGYTTLISGGAEITGFDHDVLTYTLGLGRKLSDHLSVFGALGYEAANGSPASPLAPTDGMQSVSLGGVWTQDQMKVTAALQYQKLGGAVDKNGTQFSGNHALAFGVKMAYTF